MAYCYGGLSRLMQHPITPFLSKFFWKKVLNDFFLYSQYYVIERALNLETLDWLSSHEIKKKEFQK